MNNLPKYVLDTNIIVSALLFKNSQPRQALDKARHQGNILISEAIWQEIIEVLSRPKFEKEDIYKRMFSDGVTKTFELNTQQGF